MKMNIPHPALGQQDTGQCPTMSSNMWYSIVVQYFGRAREQILAGSSGLRPCLTASRGNDPIMPEAGGGTSKFRPKFIAFANFRFQNPLEKGVDTEARPCGA
jgi:hypothetical protein